MLRRIAMSVLSLLVVGLVANLDCSPAHAQAGGSYRSPGYHYRSPGFHYRTPTYNYRTPTYSYRTPIYNYRTPIYSYRSGVIPSRSTSFYRSRGTTVYPRVRPLYYGGSPYFNYYPGSVIYGGGYYIPGTYIHQF